MINNNAALNIFKAITQESADPQIAIKFGTGDLSSIDVEFISRFVDKKTHLLDIGSGAGLSVNKLVSKVAEIIALEPIKELSKYIVSSPNVTVINESILTFCTDQKFNVISCFGVMQYFNANEAELVYKKIFTMLKSGGVLIVKNQFGVTEDVIVSGYSEKLKMDYCSEYRHLQKELDLLQKCGGTDITVHDIYAPEHNHWKNTHFYALVARKN